MIEKYCDVKYRDYLLDIKMYEFFPKKYQYRGKNENIYFLAGPDTNVFRIINCFINRIDDLLGERKKEEEYLFLIIIYKNYKLEIWLKEDSSYLAWINNFDFASWGTWGKEKLVEIIEAFREKVDSDTGKDLIHTVSNYSGYTLIVKKKEKLFIGNSTINGEEWYKKSYDLYCLISEFKSEVDKLSNIETSKLDRLVELTEESGLYEYF